MIISVKAALAISFVAGFLASWTLCSRHFEAKAAKAVKRILGDISPAARAEVLDAVLGKGNGR